MFLLITFGIAAFALVFIGGDSYKRMTGERNAEAELRIAVSYVETRLRKYDTSDGIRISPNPEGVGNALVFNDTINGKKYETWVLWSDGKLIEIISEKDKQFKAVDGFEIAEIDTFNVSYDTVKHEFGIGASITVNGEVKSIETQLSLRSGR
jgi:hypothetical protein